jgi:hypothetical protein
MGNPAVSDPAPERRRPSSGRAWPKRQEQVRPAAPEHRPTTSFNRSIVIGPKYGSHLIVMQPIKITSGVARPSRTAAVTNYLPKKIFSVGRIGRARSFPDRKALKTSQFGGQR